MRSVPCTAGLCQAVVLEDAERCWGHVGNDGKTRHTEHIGHHDANNLLIGCLLTAFALTIERLYRLRYLHRGRYRPLPASEFVLLLLLSLSLGRPRAHDASSDRRAGLFVRGGPGADRPAGTGSASLRGVLTRFVTPKSLARR